MEIKYITQAIFNLAPNAEFAFVENDLTTLEWHNHDVAKPSNAQIMAETERIQNLPIVEPTVAEKLSMVGLSIDDLKAALGV